MKPARWLALSIGVNGLLLAVLLNRAFQHPPRAAFISEITNRTIRVVPQPNSVESRPTNSIEIIEPFHWSQLESEDYRVYAANLRALGCPEATVRDIIIADVNELFSRRVEELVAPVKGHFWDLMADHEQFRKIVDEKESELNELTIQRKTLLDELLGKTARRGLNEELADLEAREASKELLDFLAPGTMSQCLELDQEFASAQQELANSQPPLAQSELQAKLKQLREKHERELEQLLSPEELAEYRLRKSGFADVRFKLAGFQATEDELKQLVRIHQDVPGVPPSGQQQQREQMNELLGLERFAQFERAQDPKYQEFYQIAGRFEVANEAVANAFDMRKLAEEKAGAIRGDKNISREDRIAALKAIQLEANQSLQKALGAQAFAAYRARSGQWLDQLEGAK